MDFPRVRVSTASPDRSALTPVDVCLPRRAVWEGRNPDVTNPSLLATPDQQEHARRRKLWNRAFTTSALKEYEEFISKRASELIDYLTSNQTVDLNVWFGRFR